MNKQAGFTLIELVVVITILGILAAFALPRFSNIQVEARQAKLTSAVGAVKSAMNLFHSQCLVLQGSNAGASNDCTSLDMEGVSVSGVNKYPTANASGIIAAAGLTVGAGEDFQTTGGTVATPALTIKIPAPNDTCDFTYTAASGTNTAPTVAITHSTCD